MADTCTGIAMIIILIGVLIYCVCKLITSDDIDDSDDSDNVWWNGYGPKDDGFH